MTDPRLTSGTLYWGVVVAESEVAVMAPEVIV